MQKQFESTAGGAAVSDADLEAINRYTQKDVTKDEVFVFSVVLCDNEIDRDNERFTVEALYALAPLFEGKTAIQDHDLRADLQCARTFKTEVLCDTDRKTSLGEPYTFLKATCYMPRIAQNADLIAEIEAGIKKEVSVGCAVQSRVCSICGADSRTAPCAHHAGRIYDGVRCHYRLEQPTDAYEWSFVAVPAQKAAGVTKKGYRDADALLKAMTDGSGASLTLSKAEMETLKSAYTDLAVQAADGAAYRDRLKTDVVKAFAQLLPTLDTHLTAHLCAPLTVKELETLQTHLKAAKPLDAVPQLFTKPDAPNDAENGAFKFV